MNKTTKVLTIVLAALIPLGALMLVGVMTGSSQKNSRFCGYNWQQGHLDDVLEKQSTLISSTAALYDSIRLVPGDTQKVERFDTKASMDCLDGSPASVSFKKQVAVNETVQVVSEKATNELTSQGYAVDVWELNTRCGNRAAYSSVTKGEFKESISIQRQSMPCADMPDDQNKLWELTAADIYMSTTISALGYTD